MDFTNLVAQGLLKNQTVQNTPVEDKSFMTHVMDLLGGKQTFENPNVMKVGTRINAQKLRDSIGYNETRGEKDPYSFSRFSGSKNLGDALGAYQVTEGELKTYAPIFTGNKISRNDFMNNPEVQQNYMDKKIAYLEDKYKWTPEQILAAHRGGFGKPQEINRILSERQNYVNEGMNIYNGTSTGTSVNKK